MESAQQIKISIITPSYNCAAFIKETIESVLVQGEKSLEHIVMDGGSIDGTVEILKSYPHLTWVSEKDRGQSHALNKGFSLARGEIIGWLNADDTYEPGTFAKVFSIFEQNPQIDFIGTDIHIIDEQSNHIGFSKGKEFNLQEMLRVNTVKQPTVFMRKAMVKKLVGVDESLHYVMDHEYWVRAYTEGFCFKYIPSEVFANFRLVRGTKSFESAPKFHLEWEKAVQGFSTNWANATNINFNVVMKDIKSQYHITMTVIHMNNKNRMKAIYEWCSAVWVNPSLSHKKSTYYYLILIIAGKERNILSKYRKK